MKQAQGILFSRRGFLSAIVAFFMLVGVGSPASAKKKPVPNLAGLYLGSATSTSGETVNLVVVLTSDGKKLEGTLSVVPGGPQAEIKGSVDADGDVRLHGKLDGRHIDLRGTYTGISIVGEYKAGRERGTFVLGSGLEEV